MLGVQQVAGAVLGAQWSWGRTWRTGGGRSMLGTLETGQRQLQLERPLSAFLACLLISLHIMRRGMRMSAQPAAFAAGMLLMGAPVAVLVLDVFCCAGQPRCC